MHTCVEISKVRLQIGTVRLPCYAVHSHSRITFEPVIRFGEEIDIHVVEQRGKSLVPMLPRRLP
jgi:hypothetical protein